MIWTVVLGAIAGITAGIAIVTDRKNVSKSSAILTGAFLSAASWSPSVATVAVGIAAGKLPKAARGSTTVALGVSTYALIYVLLNEHILLIPTIFIAIAAALDDAAWKRTRGAALPATIIASSLWIGWSGPAAAGIFCALLGTTGYLYKLARAPTARRTTSRD